MAVGLLGLSSDQFYGMTPRQFHLLVEAYQRKLEHLEMLNGLVCSTVANWSMGAPKKPLSHAEFMPSQWMKETKAPRKKREKKLDANGVREVFRSMFAGLIKHNV